MAIAKVTLPDGTTVNIEGTPEEVAALVQRISPSDSPKNGRAHLSRAGSGAVKSKALPVKLRPMGPIDYVRGLIGEDYFIAMRGIGEIKAKLDERAHFYPVTSLSPALVRLVRKRELRRIKEDGLWKYVNP